MGKRTRSDDEQDNGTTAAQEIPCTYMPCLTAHMLFHSYPEYESHVQSYHTHICQSCKKRFPSQVYLTIHIEENHDPFFQIKRERGDKVYKCLEYSAGQGCNKLCSSKSKRRLHMIDKHGYPRDYKFGVIDYGI